MGKIGKRIDDFYDNAETLYELLVADQQILEEKQNILDIKCIEIGKKEQEIELLKNTAQEFGAKLNEIYLSHGYRALQKYYNLSQKNKITRAFSKGIHRCLNRIFHAPAGPPLAEKREIEKQSPIFQDKQNQKTFDIIFLAMIDWTYRFQRPQHLAKGLAQKGYRVYFINPTFLGRNRKQKGNLVSVTFENEMPNINGLSNSKDLFDIMSKVEALVKMEGIKNAIVISEYPTWAPVCHRLKKRYGFPVAFDYLDDVRDFTHLEHSELLNECFDQMFEISDLVFASSSYLFDKAERQNSNCLLLRNGTEFAHFYQAYEKREQSERPVVGYYGEISNWFDDRLMVYAAKNLPEYDFVLIGNHTYGHVEELEKLSNVKLLGEKPYGELPGYLKSFDVAVIPFDASRDLIKATNPVKFYEYLSAGKKIVATEIPELMPYRNEYALLSNEPSRFVGYLKECIEGRDGLKGEEERLCFARKNDWTNRVEILGCELEKLQSLSHH